MRRYDSTITLLETGECIKEDTRLRINGVVQMILDSIPEGTKLEFNIGKEQPIRREKDFLIKVIQHDMEVLNERLS